MPTLTVEPAVRQSFAEANPPEWARILAPFVSMVAPGATGAALSMVPQQRPETSLGTYSQYAPLALVLPALMGYGRGAQTFGQPLMDQMRKYLHTRTLARMPARELTPEQQSALGGLQTSVTGGLSYRPEADPMSVSYAVRAQNPGGGRPSGIELANVDVTAGPGTRFPLTGTAPTGPAMLPPGAVQGPRRYVVVDDMGTNAFAVMEDWANPTPYPLGEPFASRSTRPISRHATYGEALEAAKYYQMRENVAQGQNFAPENNPPEGPQTIAAFPVAMKSSGRYAPLNLRPYEAYKSLKEMFPWLYEPPASHQE